MTCINLSLSRIHQNRICSWSRNGNNLEMTSPTKVKYLKTTTLPWNDDLTAWELLVGSVVSRFAEKYVQNKPSWFSFPKVTCGGAVPEVKAIKSRKWAWGRVMKIKMQIKTHNFKNLLTCIWVTNENLVTVLHWMIHVFFFPLPGEDSWLLDLKVKERCFAEPFFYCSLRSTVF